MICFRTAVVSEAASISHLVNSAYRGDSSRKGWTTEADFLDGQRTDETAIMEMISDPLAQIELACNSANPEIILGSVYLNFATPGTLYFGMLTVDPNRQGKGLGKELLAHLETKAKVKKCKQIRMTVIRGRDELIAFYERRGYRPTGKTEPFPMHDPRFGIPKKTLEFLEFLKTLT